MSDSPPIATPPAPTPQPVTQTTFTVYTGPPLDTIRSLVASQFQVKDAFLDPYGVPTIQVAAEPPRVKFKTLLAELGKNGLVAALRGAGDSLTLKVFQKPQLQPPRRWINLALFVATVATLYIGGSMIWSATESGDPNISLFKPGANPFIEAGLFAGGLLSIVGLHEFGHKGAAWYHHLDATLPYFIPGPPPIGTFGALISLRAPPANRNELFDLGLSGPVVGFLVTILVALLSIRLGVVVTPAVADQLLASGQFGSNLCLPLVGGSQIASCEAPLLLFIGNIANIFAPPNSQGLLIFNTQLGAAAHIGALLTFLNLVPAWQLDGGHVSRAVFGPNGHRTATLVGLVILFVSGYIVFAFFLLLMMNLTRRGFAGVEPLDDVSPVSNSRKLLYLLAIVMLLLTFFPSPIL